MASKTGNGGDKKVAPFLYGLLLVNSKDLLQKLKLIKNTEKNSVESLKDALVDNFSVLRNILSEELKRRTETGLIEDFESLLRDLGTTYYGNTEDEEQITKFSEEVTTKDLQIIVRILSKSNSRLVIRKIINLHPSFHDLRIVKDILSLYTKIAVHDHTTHLEILERNLDKAELKCQKADHMFSLSWKYASSVITMYPVNSGSSRAATQLDIEQIMDDMKVVLKGFN